MMPPTHTPTGNGKHRTLLNKSFSHGLIVPSMLLRTFRKEILILVEPVPSCELLCGISKQVAFCFGENYHIYTDFIISAALLKSLTLRVKLTPIPMLV